MLQGKTFFWDFFGPRADGTALHFQKHLEEFLSSNQVSGCETSIQSEGSGHVAVLCRAPSDAHAVIEGALRPRRSVTDTSD